MGVDRTFKGILMKLLMPPPKQVEVCTVAQVHPEVCIIVMVMEWVHRWAETWPNPQLVMGVFMVVVLPPALYSFFLLHQTKALACPPIHSIRKTQPQLSVILSMVTLKILALKTSGYYP